MKLRVKSPGSGGELIQGTVDGEPFLVTCPIDLYAEAVISTRQNWGCHTKAQLAQEKTLAYLGYRAFPFGIQLVSMLPQGKGLASSSADIAVVCQLTALSLGHQLTTAEIAAIAAAIEPTDGVFCEGIVQFNHLHGTIKKTWPAPPDLSLLLFDCGGAVDTLTFNRRHDLQKLNAAKEEIILEALSLLDEGLLKNQPQLIGEAATLSAFANQEILYKEPLTKIYDIASYCGAIGINIAHSGTIVGVMFASVKTEEITNTCRIMREKCPEVTFLKKVNLISGGLRIEEIYHV